MLRRSAGAIAWTTAAIFFATLLVAVFHIEHIGPGIESAVVLLAAIAMVSPISGLPLLAALVPIAAFVVSGYANPAVNWAEVAVVACLFGVSVRALTLGRARRLHPTLAVPGIVFGALVVASMVVSLAVMRLRLGPVFADIAMRHLTSEHFFDARAFPALQAGILLLEGLVLFAATAREGAANSEFMTRAIRGTAAGATFAATINVATLLRASARADDFWSDLGRYASTLRLSVPFRDVNAAGSYFVLGALLASAVAAGFAGYRRVWWAASAALVFAALWLTGSRAALLAAILGAAVAFVVKHLGRQAGRRQRYAFAFAAAAAITGVVVTLALPHRGTQKSSFTAVDVRYGLAQASVRMIASQPIFGIGLGEFYQRSGEFSSPELVQLFPPAVHENAHNNFLQIAAELGLAGLLTFVCLIGVIITLALRAVARAGTTATALTAAAVCGFVLTWLGGHPLLISEIAFSFWIAAGALAGTTAEQMQFGEIPRWRSIVAVALIAVAITLPWRVRGNLREANLEHIGIGVTGWTEVDDTERYRTAVDHATLFIPAGVGFRLRVKPLADHPIPLELRLDGRVADILLLLPNEWNDVRIQGKSGRPESRFVPLELRLDTPADKPVTIRITKVVPNS